MNVLRKIQIELAIPKLETSVWVEPSFWLVILVLEFKSMPDESERYVFAPAAFECI
jgi:hypothetical protein